MLRKQAKVLSDQQIKAVLGSLEKGRNARRNRVMFLLSLHGLRAKEISALEVSMVVDADGNVGDAIRLEDKAAKMSSGRIVYMNNTLRNELKAYLDERNSHESPFLIVTERSERFSPNAVAVLFQRLYQRLGFKGLSSHSGRRTFITKAARKISLAGGSLRDVQALAGHRHLSSTQAYIEQDSEAQRKIASMIY